MRTQTRTQGGGHVTVKAGVRVMFPQAEESQRLPANVQVQGRVLEQILSQPQKESILQHLVSDFSSVQLLSRV